LFGLALSARVVEHPPTIVTDDQAAATRLNPN
jgi:hypothetical protein